MGPDTDALATLVAKDEIRELALLYSRGVDRKDPALLRTLYTAEGMDYHGDKFRGTAEDYVAFLEASMPYLDYSGHHICNHLIAVDGDEGHGEVYALAYHIYGDGKGGHVEDLQTVRYLDHYRKEDGRWKFAERNVIFDAVSKHPIPTPARLAPPAGEDESYAHLTSRLFAAGPRA
jgi:ketosteroid isomerase-like protein